MKKIILSLLFAICSLLYATLNVHAATSTPSPIEQQIDQLKDKIASRVAQLKLVEKRGVIGKVNDLTDTQISLTDVKGNIRFVDVDELTKFSSLQGGSFGISDIKKGETLGVLGLYNKQSRRILARSVSQLSLPKMLNGNIASLDSDNFVFHIATDKNEQFDISVETTTRTLAYDSVSQELVRSGFSRLKVNQKVFVRGAEKENKKISAEKIIVFPDIVKTQQSLNVEPPTSTGSGKKLTPITR